MKNDENLHKWVNNELNPEELEKFKLRPEYDSLVKLYQNTDGLKVPPMDEAAMLQSILSQKKPEDSTEKEPPPSRRIFMADWFKYAAAAVVLLLTSWYFLSSPIDSGVYQVAKAEKLNGTLPDGSTFVLNAESELVYDAKTWDSHRLVKLKGEVFFNVKKGSTFTVKTTNGRVEVLGTQFNVWSRNKLFEVICQSGRVRVTLADGTEAGILQQDEAIRINPDLSIERWQSPTTELPSWITGLSKFKKVSLSIVLAEIERQYDIAIDSKSINADEIVSCNFQHNDLDLALKTTLTAGIAYQIKGKKVTLSPQ